MVNRILKIFIDFENEQIEYEFSLVESFFTLERIDTELEIESVNDKEMRLTIFGNKVKILAHIPYQYRINKNEETFILTVVYTDVETADRNIIPNHRIEIIEHTRYQETYGDDIKEETHYIYPIKYSIFPLSIINKNIYIIDVDTDLNQVTVRVGEDRNTGEVRTLDLNNEAQVGEYIQGGNTEESFYQKIAIVRLKLVSIK